MAWYKRPDRGPAAVAEDERREVPPGVWTKCKGCGDALLDADLRAAAGVCPKCRHHHTITSRGILDLLLDEGSFEPLGDEVLPTDPLAFRDTKWYRERLKAAQGKTGLSEAVRTGLGTMKGRPVALGAMAFEFLGGSMGSVVGERLARMLERALARRVPAIICSASGGARMQEGILSLMQMAKTTAALRRLKAAGLPYISVLHHPTTGGVAASFSMLGDVNLAEPGALIGFAGPRVIEQTIRQKLPEGFQRAEFLLEHGMVDRIVQRSDLRDEIVRLIDLLGGRCAEPAAAPQA